MRNDRPVHIPLYIYQYVNIYLITNSESEVRGKWIKYQLYVKREGKYMGWRKRILYVIYKFDISLLSGIVLILDYEKL